MANMYGSPVRLKRPKVKIKQKRAEFAGMPGKRRVARAKSPRAMAKHFEKFL